MSEDETEDRRPDGDAGERRPSGPSRNGPGPEMDRLPPPAFPPGSRRASAPRKRVDVAGAEESPDDAGEGEELPDDAFISPDEPIRKEARGIPDDAFISPDDPFTPKATAGSDEGQVTSMGEQISTRTPTAAKRRSEAPSIHELPYLLDRVAEQINDTGREALNVHGEMGHFEAALKSFLRGYLQGSVD